MYINVELIDVDYILNYRINKLVPIYIFHI